MSTNCICSVLSISTQIPTSFTPSNLLSSLPISSSSFIKIRENTKLNSIKNGIFTGTNGRRKGVIVYGLPSIDPWAPNIDSQSIASQLFALSLFPYLGFLYFITKSKSAPKLTLFGFYFLLAFVGATIPAGIYGYIFGLVPNSSAFLAKVHYGTSLSNVDWLHGGAESLLTLSNLFVVLGLRKGLREPIPEDDQSDEFSGYKKKNSSS